MKIGIVLPGILKYSETFFNYKIKGLIESGNEVLLFTADKNSENFPYRHFRAYPVFPGKKIKQAFFFVYVMIMTLIKCPGRFLRLFNLERKQGTSFTESLKIIYINAHILNHSLDWLHFGFATMALKRENTAKAMGAFMGVSFRGYDINIYPLKNPGCYKKLWESVDKVHTISGYLHKKAVRLGLPENVPYEKITPAIDLNRFKFKNNNGRLNKKLKILTIGRLNWIKDYETAISAMKLLKDNEINFEYNIIGSGKEAERLKFAVYQSGLENEINFHGVKSQEEIYVYLSSSDIYLQTSIQEGFCVSVLEAQASGLLCVVSDADGLKENVIDKVTGWIVSKRNPGAFAEKISDILKMSESEREVVIKNARERIENEFRIESQNKLFKNFFENKPAHIIN